MEQKSLINSIFFSLIIIFCFKTTEGKSGKQLPQSDSKTINAEIIEFDMLKCGCCWGWIIKVESDTIKADYLPDKSIVPIHNAEELPIKVKIQIGSKLNRCTKDYSYYEIKYIERISH